MRVSHILSAAICAGAFALTGHVLAEEAAADPAASVEKGKALFNERCATCHTGTVAPAPAEVGKLDLETFHEKVKNHAKVGAFDGLSEQDLNDIHAYQKSLSAG